ncbi:leucine--tRNA ligase [Candidatus Peregrinibacteria bacterium CG10_big_fil_rev_8_21_14_0_10_36_19]|nr:MAG: leucine--tRNA ligase [Candidatus Peregrinibacteria bacterium CG10_big_fil_rev_8_21_14_0_10_36_19]
MANYQARETEQKWQKRWKETGLYKVDVNNKEKEKYYNLVMFPYPSGDKLHIGHWYNFAPADSWGRYMKMRGFEVLQPMGYDSFGLPAENYAIKTGIHPKQSIATNTEKMTKQLSDMGAMWNWENTVSTSTPEFYKWTQWVFLKLYEKDLAYKKKAPVNWCDDCKTVLANEQVQDGKCDRCKNEVTKKELNQWFFNIREYADKLLDYDGLDWPEKTIAMQKNWIGKSKGVNVSWKVKDQDITLDTFTTTVDTIFGVTFVVISPEHPDLFKLVTPEHSEIVSNYIEKAKSKSEIDRMEEKDKSGVFTGSYVVHPLSGKEVPLWVADYVLMSYGTGVVMGVPAHDKRDMDFANKYQFPIVQSVELENGETFLYDDVDKYNVNGRLVDSDSFSGMEILSARSEIVEKLKEMNMGEWKTQYKLRDWLISRQRYWGAPIPVVYDPDGNAHAVPEKHLPWLLPEDVEFRPDGTSPLAQSQELKNRTEELFGKGWTPEVDTMDTFVCSSWYYLRYPSVGMDGVPFDKALTNKWLPVDMYIGGPEHACMHLLYSRFINMVLHDLGYINFKEPFKKLVHQGMVTKDGAKMSKSKGNVVGPDEFVEKYGSDVFRMYLMFMGPFTDGGDWNDKGITGTARFVERFWNLMNEESVVLDAKALEKNLHKLIKKVTQDIEKMHFNTVVAAMMEFVNFANKNGIDRESKKILAKLIAPIAPHLAEECWWAVLNEKYSIFGEDWPTYSEELTKDNNVIIGVQVNGKVRGEVEVSVDAEKSEVIALAKNQENVAKYLAEGEVVKEIYVPGKIVGFVIK